MKAAFEHFQYNAHSDQTAAFWKDLLGYMEMNTVVDVPGVVGISDGNTSFWVLNSANKDAAFNRDANGLNHVGLKLSSSDDVKQFEREFLQPRGIQPQFETPRTRPDFGPNYYQVMFLDPEGLAIEVFCS